MENATAPKPPWKSKLSGLPGSRVKLGQSAGTQEVPNEVTDKPSRFFASFGTDQPQSMGNTAGNPNTVAPPAGSFPAPRAHSQRSCSITANPQDDKVCQPSAAPVTKPGSNSTAVRLGDLSGLADLLDLPSGGVSLKGNSAASAAAGAHSIWTTKSTALSEQAPDSAPAKKGFAAAQRRGHTNLLRASFTKRPTQVTPGRVLLCLQDSRARCVHYCIASATSLVHPIMSGGCAGGFWQLCAAHGTWA